MARGYPRLRFPPGEFTYLIHAATEASASLNNEEPLVMLDSITAGTRRVLDFAAQQPLKAFLFTSSGAVYGKQPPEMTHIPETYTGAPDPLDPKNAYAEGKRYAELLCSIYSRQYHVPVKIARCFAFVGPYLPLDIHFAIGNFIRDGLNGGPIVVKGRWHALPVISVRGGFGDLVVDDSFPWRKLPSI